MPTKDSDHKIKLHRAFLLNFIGGMGWAFGMTVGFAFLAYIISLILCAIGGVPLIGTFFANVINQTQDALNSKTPTIGR